MCCSGQESKCERNEGLEINFKYTNDFFIAHTQ